jgi:DNA-binding MarR family transcriptional regulator
MMNAAQQSRRGFIEAGQMAVFWRILHMMVIRYGNQPMGHALVVLTLVYLNERGMPPTMTQLCKATGLPKASVSRYVSSQIKQELIKERVDPEDRRRRMLVLTSKGKTEWRWQVKQMDRIFSEVEDQLAVFRGAGDPRRAEELFELMSQRTRDAKHSVKQ